MARFRDRNLSIRRRPPTRDPRQRLLVVCEGRKTEPLYLKWYQHHTRNRLVHVEINNQSGVPKTLVDRAIELRDSADADARRAQDDNLRFDETWCVFDVDDHPAIEESCQKARANSIQVAISNPCFELWALLHYRDQTAWIDRNSAQSALRSFIADYEKELPFAELAPRYAQAVSRAVALDQSAERDAAPGRNPTTGVHLLTERIRTYGQK